MTSSHRITAIVIGSTIWVSTYAGSPNLDDTSVKISITGPEEIVFSHDRDACDIWDIPDVPARAFRDDHGNVQLIASHFTTRRMIGPDLDHLKHDCRVVMESSLNPDPGKFDDHEWIRATYTEDGKTIYALVHDEYHGWEHDSRCSKKPHPQCWYNAVTLAISKDSGDSYQQAHAPNQFVAGIPYRFSPDTGQAGIFGPTNIIQNNQDGYYYVFFRIIIPDHGKPARGIGIMRTKNLSDPESWRAWGGSRFDVRFADPYLTAGNIQHEKLSPLSQHELGDMIVSGLTWNNSINQYIMFGVGHVARKQNAKPVWAICYSLSTDLIHWSERQYLKEVVQPVNFVRGGPDPIAYPSPLDPESASRNFETTGIHFFIYYTHYNYNNFHSAIPHADRDLARVPVSLELIPDMRE